MANIIILALIAVFIALRLRAVLGRRTGFEHPPEQPGITNGPRTNSTGTNSTGDNVVDLANHRGVWAADPGQSQDPANGLRAIQSTDPSFDAGAFQTGAQAAFAIIVDAFGRSDRETLRPLVSPQVFRNFDSAAELRDRSEGNGARNRVLTISEAAIVAAGVERVGADQLAEITVRFTSTQAVNEGTQPETSVHMVDLWTFQRRLGSNDPTWILAATRAVDA